MEHIEIQQDPDMTDSEMMEVIKQKLADGWGLVEYQWKDGIKWWTFEF